MQEICAVSVLEFFHTKIGMYLVGSNGTWLIFFFATGLCC